MIQCGENYSRASGSIEHHRSPTLLAPRLPANLDERTYYFDQAQPEFVGSRRLGVREDSLAKTGI